MGHPTGAHHQMTDSGEKSLPWELRRRCQGWLARHHLRVVPQKLQHREDPLLRSETAASQKPGAVRILEAVNLVTQQSGVPFVENGVFVVALTRGRPIRQQFVQIRGSDAGEDRVTASRSAR